MADVKWIKIVTDIFDDEKILLIETLPEADSIIVIWFKLLCLAGKQNNSGVFQLNGHIPYTDEMFATIFRRKINTVRLALSTFEQYGMVEIINNTVTIPNWGKHQSIEQIEARREYQRNYQRQYYAKQKALAEQKDSKRLEKCLGNDLDKSLSKPNLNTPDKIREDKNISYVEGFDAFYKAYPRKVSKATAQKAWSRLKPNEDLQQTILADIARRKGSEWAGKDIQYIPHPATYLNQRRWEDEAAGQVDDDYRPTLQEIIEANGGERIVPGFDKPFGVD